MNRLILTMVSVGALTLGTAAMAQTNNAAPAGSNPGRSHAMDCGPNGTASSGASQAPSSSSSTATTTGSATNDCGAASGSTMPPSPRSSSGAGGGNGGGTG